MPPCTVDLRPLLAATAGRPTAHADPKLRVEYALTPLGRSILEPLDAACQWATEHWDELLDAREVSTSPIG